MTEKLTSLPRRDLPVAEPLWRALVGRQLRRRRLERGDTLIETAERAGISPQYLSEIERGVKDPSSEMVAGALGTTLLDLVGSIAGELRPSSVPAASYGGRGGTYAMAA